MDRHNFTSQFTALIPRVFLVCCLSVPSVQFSFCFCFPSVFFLEGFGLDPPPFVNIFPFFNKIPRVWWHRMTVSRGANLIEMSMMSLDVCHFSLLIKKKCHSFFFLSILLIFYYLFFIFFYFDINAPRFIFPLCCDFDESNVHTKIVSFFLLFSSFFFIDVNVPRLIFPSCCDFDESNFHKKKQFLRLSYKKNLHLSFNFFPVAYFILPYAFMTLFMLFCWILLNGASGALVKHIIKCNYYHKRKLFLTLL